MLHFNTERFKDATAIWQSAVKSRSRLSAWLVKAIPMIVGSNSLSWIKAGSSFSRFAHRIYVTQGSRGLALYLKSANLLLIRATAGKRLMNARDAGVAVSCNANGLPRCIIPIHRARIRNGEVAVIRLWLGFFTLYRVLAFRGKLSIASVVAPGVDIFDFMCEWKEFCKKVFLPMLKKTFSIYPLETRLTKLDLNGRTRFDREKSYWYFPALEGTRLPIHTSGPSSGQGVGGSSIIGHGLDVWNWVNSIHYSMIHGMCLLTGNIHFLDSDVFSQARDLQKIVREGGAPWLRDAVEHGTEGLLGSLSVREEPGKLRIFAMVDSLTQWVLYPLHKALFSMLSKIPQDGTFDQTKPVKALLSDMEKQGLEHVWSYDLSTATDRIPLLLQEYLLGLVTSPVLSYTWAKLLCDRLYRVPRILMTTIGKKGWNADPLLRKFPPGMVRYEVGQPMGAYSSWAMLAFVHHALVQFAAYRAGIRGWFTLYAVLGDDVVIAHREVAHQYVLIMKEIGVGIGFHKSVISNNRSLEFAKRYFFRGVEVTPLPLLGISTGWLGVSMVPEVISVVERLTGQVLSSFQIGKFLGVGFKACSGADHNLLWKLPRRLRSVLVLLLHPGAPRGAPELWSWLRAKSLRGQALVEPKSVEGLGKYLVRWATKDRFPRLLRLLGENLEKFEPGQSFETVEIFNRYRKWFDLYIRQPMAQDFMVQRMGVERLLRGIQPFYLSSDKAITELLEGLEEFEREIAAIPRQVLRHRSQQNAVTSVPLVPNLVSWWTKLGPHFLRASAKSVRVRKFVQKGMGASPLLRTK
jgi:hypothetical protein